MARPYTWYACMAWAWAHGRYGYSLKFIQYFACNWPRHSLRGLHTRITYLIWYPYSLVFLIWYPYALVSLYGNTAHCSGCDVAMDCYGLSIVLRTAIVTSQWYDMTVIVSRNTRRRERDTRQRLDKANAWRLQTYIGRFFVWFNAICYTFLRNNLIYIEGRNCRLSTVPGLFNKCSGLRPSDTLPSQWFGWRHHARVGKPFFGNSLDL